MDINKKIKTLDLKLSKILNGWLFWAYKSKFHGSWMEFLEHREYNIWDSVKNIDWKTSSKTNNLYVKKYEEQRDLNVLFLLDISASMDFWLEEKTKKDLLIEVFYSLSLSAYVNNDNIWAFLFDQNKINYIDYKKSKHNIFKIIDNIINHKKSNTNNKNGFLKNIFNKYINNSKVIDNKKNLENISIKNIFETIHKRGIKNNLIFLLTDKTDFDNEKIIRILSRENEIVVINIFDHFENNLSVQNLNLSLNMNSDFLNIDLSDSKKINEYKQKRASKLKFLEKSFYKKWIWYIKIDSKTDLFKELIKYFIKIID